MTQEQIDIIIGALERDQRFTRVKGKPSPRYVFIVPGEKNAFTRKQLNEINQSAFPRVRFREILFDMAEQYRRFHPPMKVIPLSLKEAAQLDQVWNEIEAWLEVHVSYRMSEEDFLNQMVFVNIAAATHAEKNWGYNSYNGLNGHSNYSGEIPPGCALMRLFRQFSLDEELSQAVKARAEALRKEEDVPEIQNEYIRSAVDALTDFLYKRATLGFASIMTISDFLALREFDTGVQEGTLTIGQTVHSGIYSMWNDRWSIDKILFPGPVTLSSDMIYKVRGTQSISIRNGLEYEIDIEPKGLKEAQESTPSKEGDGKEISDVTEGSPISMKDTDVTGPEGLVPTLEEVMKNVDTDLWVKQKEWLQRQISELEPSGLEASGMPEGILNLMDALQDAAENELGIVFYPEE